MTTNSKKFLLLIDANSLIHRAYHALPPLTDAAGNPAGALYGLANSLIKVLREMKPDYVAAAFDRPEPTFREEIFKDYKIHRPPTPKDLAEQLKRARELLEKLNIKAVDAAGFEADDVIGALAEKFAGGNTKIVILTGDLDTLQLVRGDEVAVKTPKKGVSELKTYDERAVEERFGVKPSQLVDFKALTGDASDNIPGVPGIGDKTAAKIIREFGTLESALKKLNPDDKIGKKIAVAKEKALLSKKLAKIRTDVPLAVNLSDLEYVNPADEVLARYFKNLGFTSIVKRFTITDDNGSQPRIL